MKSVSFRVLLTCAISLSISLLNHSPAFSADTKDQPSKTKTEPKLVQTTTTSGEAFGGNGGGANSLRCPTNWVMTGISDSNHVAATNWYNVGLAITCTEISFSSSGSIYLTTNSSKTAVFTFSTYTANRDSICSTGNAITTVRVYANGTGFVQDVGANCKTFTSQAASEEIAAANGSNWTYITPGLSSCAAGSFATGVYGRNGEGIDRLGIYCSSFSISNESVAPAPFVSYLQRDLVMITPSSFARYGDYYLCNAGSYGYKWSNNTSGTAEKIDLESVTMILRVDGKIVGAASSDDFKLLPRWVFGIDSTLSAAKITNGSVIWSIPGSSDASKASCEIAAYKENQIRYTHLAS